MRSASFMSFLLFMSFLFGPLGKPADHGVPLATQNPDQYQATTSTSRHLRLWAHGCILEIRAR